MYVYITCILTAGISILVWVSSQYTRLHSCGLCSKLYRYRFHLYAHRREVHVVQPYQCSTCDHSFADVSALRFHESSHSAGGKS